MSSRRPASRSRLISMPTNISTSATWVMVNRLSSSPSNQAMASGVPSILSSNTGHLDLIKQGNCLRLLKMSPSLPFAHYSGVSGWMEPDVNEMVEALEKVYINRKEAGQMAKIGHKSLQSFNWKKQVNYLMEVIDTKVF